MKTNLFQLLSIAVSLFFSLCVEAQEIAPVNADSSLVDSLEIYKQGNLIKKYQGKFYAFDATIKKIHQAYEAKPYYLVEFENGKELWIASLVKSEIQQEGKKLRFLGVLAELHNTDEVAKKWNQSGYHILAFAVIDWENKKVAANEDAPAPTVEWLNGKIPDNLE